MARQDHCLVDLLWRSHSGELPMRVPLVVSNHAALQPLAVSNGARFVHLPVTPSTKEATEVAQLALLREHGIELVVLAKYM